MKNETVYMPLNNYYGILTLVKNVEDDKTKYYLHLDCHSSTNVLEVDEDVWNSLIKFKDMKSSKL